MLPVVFSDKVISDFDFTDEVVDDMVIQKQSQIYQMSVLNLIFPKLILCVVLVSSEIKAYLVQPLFLVPECYFAQNVGHQDHSLSTYAKFSEKLTSFTPRYTHVFVRVRGEEMIPIGVFIGFNIFLELVVICLS